MKTNQKIAIVTHDMFYGVPHALRDYILDKKAKELLFISHPLVEQRRSSVVLYRKGRLISQRYITQPIHGIFSYILDFLLTIYWVIKQKDKFNMLIAIDPLNAMSGLILKKLGKIDKVIFYSMDFNPIRFNSALLNFIFHKIEEICVKNADEVWNVSPKIAEGREKFLSISQKKYNQKIVSSGVWIDKIKQVPFSEVKKHQLLFLGHILKKQGLQMVLEATVDIIKIIPDFKFLILGGGEYEEVLKSKAKKLGIENHVEFKGWIRDREIIDTTLGESAAAIVTYVPEREKLYNFSYYGDPIKLKEYLASGLPVILTDVPHNAREIERNNCGIVVEYKKEKIANAIIEILGNNKRLREYRKNAVKYARKFDWNVIFSEVLN